MKTSRPDQEYPQPSATPSGVFSATRRRLAKAFRPALLATVLACPALAEDPPQMFGVNLQGGDATGSGNIPGTYGTDYIYPNAAELDYYQSKGITLIRLPFKWKRVQDSLYAPLNSTNLGHLDTAVGLIRARGMKVILDMHDYNEVHVNGTKYQVGSTQVPYSAYADVWDRLSDHFKGDAAIYGYDIMNEPKGTVSNWQAAAQAAINAIRANGDNQWILIEGIHSSRSWGWVKDGNGALLALTDPSDRLIYSAHSYWDEGGTGQYVDTYAQDNRYPTVGISSVEPFVTWCNANGVRGLIGEYGVPHSDGYTAEWNVVLDNFLDYIKSNGLSGTYWSGGRWTGGYNLTCEPTSNYTVDRPQMAVLEAYGDNGGTASEVMIDNTNSGSVTITSSWTASSSTPGYEGYNYLHDGDAGKGSKSVAYTPTLLAAGNYEVFVRWTSASNRATNVPVTIVHSGGSTGVTVNQTANGGVWNSVGTYTFGTTGGSVTISNTGTNGHVIADAVKFTPATGLPAGWSNADVGTVGVAGSTSFGGGVFTVNGSGTTIGGTADSFQFASTAITGDCTVTARVVTQTATHNYARAGVMIRSALTAGSMMADAIITPAQGAYMQSRLTTDATAATGSGGAAAAPYWVRVTRVGNVFTGYKSANGVTWTQMSTPKTIAMGSTVQVGLAVCSYNNSTLGTATFDNVTITTP